MTDEPVWVSPAAAYALHDDQIAQFGGLHGVLDRNVVESALAKPRNLYAYGDPDIADLAASYFCGLVQKQGFADGNKRTGLAVTLAFLRASGWQLCADARELFAFTYVVARNELDEAAVARWFRSNISPVEG